MLQGLSTCGAQPLCQGWATILLLGLASSRQLLLQLLACLMISQCWISLTGMGQVTLRIPSPTQTLGSSAAAEQPIQSIAQLAVMCTHIMQLLFCAILYL